MKLFVALALSAVLSTASKLTNDESLYSNETADMSEDLDIDTPNVLAYYYRSYSYSYYYYSGSRAETWFWWLFILIVLPIYCCFKCWRANQANMAMTETIVEETTIDYYHKSDNNTV